MVRGSPVHSDQRGGKKGEGVTLANLDQKRGVVNHSAPRRGRGRTAALRGPTEKEGKKFFVARKRKKGSIRRNASEREAKQRPRRVYSTN